MADPNAQVIVSEDGGLEGQSVAGTVVTTVMDAVQTNATLTLASASLQGPTNLMPAGGVAPTSDVVYQQMDLGQYIDHQVQSRLSQLSGAWQQPGMAQPWMPMQRPQFTMPMFPMGGFPTASASNLMMNTLGGGVPTVPTKSEDTSHSRKKQKREHRSEDPAGKRPEREKMASGGRRSLFHATPAPKPATVDDDSLSLYASGDNFSKSGSSSEQEDTDNQSVDGSQLSDQDSDGDDISQHKAAATTGKDAASAKAQEVKPGLKAALSSAIPVVKTSVSILPDLAEQLKETWQTPLDQARVDEILSRIHPPDNALFLRVQRTNERIYDLIKKPQIQQDASIQRTQQLTTTAAAQTAQLLHMLNDMPEGTVLDTGLLEKMMLPLAEVFTLLSHTTAKLSLSRKNKLGRAVPKHYGSIRKCSFPASDYLFGDDIDAVLSAAKKHHQDQQNSSRPYKRSSKSRKPRKGNNKSKNGKGKWSGHKKKDGGKKKDDKDDKESE